jgi:hypothetical protein
MDRVIHQTNLGSWDVPAISSENFEGNISPVPLAFEYTSTDSSTVKD